MIRIRTVTYNIPMHFNDNMFSQIENSVKLFSKIDYEVHTQRINLTPLNNRIEDSIIAEVALFCHKNDIRWFNIPLDIWDYQQVRNEEIRDVLSQYKDAFVNCICAKDARVKKSILEFIARQMLVNADADSEGLINFRFGASMNVSPNGPFFPYTYSEENIASFSIGLEMAEELNDVLRLRTLNLTQIESLIFEVLEPQVFEIEQIAKDISVSTGLVYRGIDFSLAPLPKEHNSVISILNSLGISRIDDTGAMFATAFLTRILKAFSVNHKAVGFSGVMYSLIEDKIYAEDNNSKGFSIDRMIALSTMCGCGCDMIPIPFETSVEDIKTILLEIACISSRLKKPLGVRLLPIKSNDEYTHFSGESDFCINTRIVNIHSNNSIPLNRKYFFG